MATFGSYIGSSVLATTTATSSSAEYIYKTKYIDEFVEEEKPKETVKGKSQEEKWLRNRVNEICELVDLK